MTTQRDHDVLCPSCAFPFRVEIAQGVNATRAPASRQKILDGTFQVYACPRCTRAALFESLLIYTDFERLQYVGMETPRSATHQTAKARHETIFRDCFEGGPPIAQELGAQFKRRIVFGFRALREKLLVWDAELDDRIVEAVKGDLIKEIGESPRDIELRIAEVLDGGHLMFGVFQTTRLPDDLAPGDAWQLTQSPPIDFRTAPHSAYAARAATPAAVARDFPWLDDDWLVDLHHGPSYLYR